MSDAPIILLLEDEPLILMDLELAAEDAGFKCLIATTVQQALAYFQGIGDPPDVGILDVSLQNGETCVPIAHELERLGIPYILHSGNLDRQNETIRMLDAELVPKPSSSDRVIEAALRRLRAPRGGGRDPPPVPRKSQRP